MASNPSPPSIDDPLLLSMATAMLQFARRYSPRDAWDREQIYNDSDEDDSTHRNLNPVYTVRVCKTRLMYYDYHGLLTASRQAPSGLSLPPPESIRAHGGWSYRRGPGPGGRRKNP